MFFADGIYTDSGKTLSSRVPVKFHQCKRLRIVSFVLQKVDVRSLPNNSPVFVSWGRLNLRKGIDRALHVFAHILGKRPDAVFYIYGPDGGEESKLRNLAVELNISASVMFLGKTRFEEIKEIATKFSYYLQLSRDEGMSISVVEAMQLGLVPIVTPVGEIGNYCKDGINAIVVNDFDGIVERVIAVLEDDSKYTAMQKHCVAHWQNVPLYNDDFRAAVAELDCNSSKQ
nr:glycosyltransferase family 4 protein [Geomobilimonas luticola]